MTVESLTSEVQNLSIGTKEFSVKTIQPFNFWYICIGKQYEKNVQLFMEDYAVKERAAVAGRSLEWISSSMNLPISLSQVSSDRFFEIQLIQLVAGQKIRVGQLRIEPATQLFGLTEIVVPPYKS